MTNGLSDEKVLELLQEAVSSTPPEGPAIDLWPSVRSRITTRTSEPHPVDWLLATALALLCLFRPSVAEILLIHF